MRLATFVRPVVLGTAVLALAACGSDDGSSSTTTRSTTTTTAAPTTTTTAAPTTAAPSTAPPVTTGIGCAGDGAIPPAGAVTKTVTDVDGDGKADRGWVFTGTDGVTRFGIDTAAGRQSTMNVASGSPVERAILVVNADETGPVEIIFSDGRQAKLFAYADCKIADVTNPEGETYAFDLGFGGQGTGVGCVDTADGRRLVGLNGESGGGSIQWTRTIIELDGLHAKNGAVTHGQYPQGDPAADLLHEITCGDLTMDEDGIVERDG